jgi:hypothetical protein
MASQPLPDYTENSITSDVMVAGASNSSSDANEPPDEYTHQDQAIDENLGRKVDPYQIQEKHPWTYYHLFHDHSFSQYGLSKGIEKYGDAAINAVLEEVKQLQDCEVIESSQYDSLSSIERKNSLATTCLTNRRGIIASRE